MVVVQIMQGLGNQMFQYASAKGLATQIQQPLKVNLDVYKRAKRLRSYELGSYFAVVPDVVTEQEMQDFYLINPFRRIWNRLFPKQKIRALPYEEVWGIRLMYRLFNLFSPPHKRRFYEERHFHFDNRFFKAPTHVFIKGYWQSYKYFDHIKDHIKRDYTVRRELVQHLDELVAQMAACESIALHVRTSDKLSEKNLRLYGRLTAGYYQRGVETIQAKKDGNIKLYVFTDDVNHVHTYLPQGFETVIVSGTYAKSAIEDLYLMTRCKNIVMANSSFSWWASYLNMYSDSMVVVPKKWFNKAPYNYKDVYCPGWIRI
jgi:hypothetical protein